MLTFLFWNIRNNPIQEVVARLAHRHEVDVLILAEAAFAPGALLAKLNAHRDQWFFPYSNCRKIAVYTRFPPGFLVPVEEDETARRTSIRSLCLPGLPPLLLVAVHFPSKLYKDDASQDFDLPQFAELVRDAERRAGHDRTIVVGDLNANPFSPGMAAATALHAVLSRQVAGEGGRTVNQRAYPYFYNPMWGRFGHGTDGPPGTYFRRGSTVSYFWNMFDQVLIRPSLLPFFDDKNLEILDTDGVVPFLSAKKSRPRADAVSDHLPVLFRLDL